MSQGREQGFDRDCDAALGWIARFRSQSVSESDRAQFALWLAEDPAHGRAMDRMQDLWDDLGSLRHLPDPMSRAASPGRRQWLGAAFALAASLLVALLLSPNLQAPAKPEVFQTALGERKTITLPDDSRVTLNTSSRLEVAFSDDRRGVSLTRGEAYFEVNPERERPFEVEAGNTRITVVGTAFNVLRRDDQGSDITVAEGVVRVTELNAPAARAAITEVLRTGQRLAAGREGFTSAGQVDLAPHLAWQRGELIAREMPLARLVDEIERYHDLHILIADRGVAALTVSGVFQLDHPDSILQALQRSLPVQLARIDASTVQLLPTPQ